MFAGKKAAINAGTMNLQEQVFSNDPQFHGALIRRNKDLSKEGVL
jgi:hypothetical protein